MAAQEYQAPESVGRLQQRALVIGGVALLVSILGAVRTPGLFYQSYLMSFLLILGLTVGSLGLVMLQHLVSGHWGIIIRRPLESATRTLPLIVAFFLPIVFFGMKYLYAAWLDPEERQKRTAVAVSAGVSDQRALSSARGHLFRDLACADVHL